MWDDNDKGNIAYHSEMLEDDADVISMFF